MNFTEVTYLPFIDPFFNEVISTSFAPGKQMSAYTGLTGAAGCRGAVPGAAVRAAAGRPPSTDRPGWPATRTESRDARHRARAAGPGRSGPDPCSANCAG